MRAESVRQGVRALVLMTAAVLGLAQWSTPATAQAPARPPNILVIMGDDVGWFNIGAYHQGIMSGKTPNLDKLAAEGMRFTDYYAEASCTAGRANFITGEMPLRTGLTTVGQAGADVGMPDQAVTLATVLKSLGYETGQFGKNHLGDLNKYLPTVHGFDEFFGYLYHLDAMSDPYWFDYPQDWIDKYGPRNLVHSYATDVDDPTVQPRWGKVGKQRIVDEGPLAPFPNMAGRQNWQEGRKAKYDMETFDEVLVEAQQRLHGQGQEGRQAVLHLAQHDAHARLHLHPAEVPGDDELPEQLRPGRSRHGADGRQHRRPAEAPAGHRRGRQHHRHLHHRQRRGSLHLAGRRHDAVPGHQGHRVRGRLPRAGDHPLAGQGQAGHGRERHLLRPRLAADARRRGGQLRTSPSNC